MNKFHTHSAPKEHLTQFLYLKIILFKSFFVSFLCLFVSSFLTAQLLVKPDVDIAQYKVGELMHFEVSSSSSGSATYTLSYDTRTPIIETGTIDISAGNTKRIAFRNNQPGVVQCVVNQGNNWSSTAAAFGVYDIDALESEPSDFDAFWNQQKAALDQISLAPQVSFYSNTGSSKSYKVSLKLIDNRRVYGYITIPDGDGPFPALISLPAFGDGANLTSPQDFVADAAKAISISLSIHNVDPEQSDPNAYKPNDISDREGLYYRYGILAAVRMIDYLHTRDEFDGENVGLMGVSQGAGLGIMVAGLDDRVNLLMNSNPILAQQTGLKYDQPSGFPYYIWQSRVENGSPSHEAETIEAIKYYDPIYFAKRFDGASLMFISYKDETVPPATSFAAYNALGGQKVLMHSLDLGHVHPPEFWNGRFDFIRRHYPATIHNPFQNTTGYGADAGSDQTIALNESATLNGEIENNNSSLNSLPARWTKVSGPGEVTFSNSNSYNTNVSFSQEGTYTLRFSADDLQKLDGEAKFYTISDELKIIVGEEEEEEEEEEDNQAPSVELSFLDFDENGNVLIMVDFNEDITGLWYNDFIISSGTIVELTGFGGEYLLVIEPDGTDLIEVQVEQGGVTDAAGNGNSHSNTLQVEIPNTSNCLNVSSGGLISGNESECGAFSPEDIESISLPEDGGDIEYKWQKSTLSSTGPWQDISGANWFTYNPSYLTETTWFRRLARRSGCGDYEGISNIIVKEVSSDEGSIISTIDYCTGKGAQPWWQWIKKVQIGDFTNVSTKEGFGDFAAQSIRVVKGEDYSISLLPGFSGENFKEYWRIWIDFNQDGDFYDSGELVFSDKSSTLINGEISIPHSVKSGITRMRISMKNGGFANACEQYTYGEMEDYSIFISNNAQTNYCEQRGKEPENQWIRKVIFGEIENRSSKDKYGDFTGLKTTVNTGESYPITLDADYKNASFPVYWRVWIDFNQNGDFSSNEMVFTWFDDEEVSGHIYIPPYAAAGTTRMRITMQKGDYASDCETFDFGEVEDYSIQIQECGASEMLASATLELRGNKQELGTQLYWVTNTEYKNDFFVLERSTDNIHFEPIQEIVSKNDDYLIPNSYQKFDDHPFVGKNYYRIKQVFKNGMFQYSQVTEVVFNVDVDNFSVFPNPANDRLYLNLKPYLYEPVDIHIYNRFGQEMKHLSLEYAPDYPVYMDLKDYLNGFYYITVKVKGHRMLSQKFVIGQTY